MRPQSEEVVAIKKIRLGKVKEVRGGTPEHGQRRHRGRAAVGVVPLFAPPLSAQLRDAPPAARAPS